MTAYDIRYAGRARKRLINELSAIAERSDGPGEVEGAAMQRLMGGPGASP